MKETIAFYLAIPFAALSLFLFEFNNQLFFSHLNFWTSIFGWDAICGSHAFFLCRFGGWLGVMLTAVWAVLATISSGLLFFSLHKLIHRSTIKDRNVPVQTEKMKRILTNQLPLSIAFGELYLLCLLYLVPMARDASVILVLALITGVLYFVFSKKMSDIPNAALGLARSIAFSVFAGFAIALVTYAYFYLDDLIFLLFIGYAEEYLSILIGAVFVSTCVFTFAYARSERVLNASATPRS